MKPVAFEYCRPGTLDEALDLLAEFGTDASLLAGGLSLGAMLNMRLVRPTALIDINTIPGLASIDAENGVWRIGALVRQSDAMVTPDLAEAVPLLSAVLPFVGHYQTRARGTFGGSVAHADPSAEIPLALVTLGGEVELRSRRRARRVPARDFFEGLLTTARAPDEMVSALLWPRQDPTEGYAFHEIAQRHGDFAIVAAAARAQVGSDRTIEMLSFGLGGVEDRPFTVDCTDHLGAPATAATAREIGEAAARSADPMEDLQANADYRRHLVGEIGTKVLTAAFEAAGTRET